MQQLNLRVPRGRGPIEARWIVLPGHRTARSSRARAGAAPLAAELNIIRRLAALKQRVAGLLSFHPAEIPPNRVESRPPGIRWWLWNLAGGWLVNRQGENSVPFAKCGSSFHSGEGAFGRTRSVRRWNSIHSCCGILLQ